MIDLFTRYAVAEPLRGITGEQVAEVSVNRWMCCHGVPLKELTDQGSTVEGGAL